MPAPDPKVATMKQLAAEWRAMLRHGQQPVMDTYLERYPHLATDIRELFPAILAMENLKGDVLDHTVAPAADAEPAPMRLERLGDFRILREIGHGGMGVVYEAEQVSLGRRVALKVLPPHLLPDPKHRKRFEREAKAAARLHHTNIVPVYGVGESEGLFYYVMQFIHGLGLDEVLLELRKQRRAKSGSKAAAKVEPPLAPAERVRDISAVDVARSLLTGQYVPPPRAPGLTGESDENTTGPSLMPSLSPPPQPAETVAPSASSGAGHSTLSESGRRYWQSVARIGVQVAEALDYAASQGILHRDIKPSNLLLDTQNNVWVTDFGLAKATADEENLTHTGDIVGTLRYMAPERFEGRSDVRGDVYSLGLTLYELLVQRPAFDETDRNRLIHRVTHEEPPHPRKLNPAIPRDLETIVLKAIEREPGRRYQTPKVLAQDLKRFLEDKPILARRVGAGERFWRWCRRNPAVACLAGGIAALLVIAAVASTLAAFHFGDLARQEHAARQDAEGARIRAEDAQQREAEERRKADEARLTAEAAQKREADQRRQAEQARIAAEAAQKREAEQRLKAEAAQKDAETSMRQARKAVDDYLTTVSESVLLREPGLQPLRKVLLESALAYYKGFLRQRSDDPSIQRDVAVAYLRVGKVTAEIGSPTEAQKAYDEALRVLTKIEPKTPELQLDLAAVHQAAGNLHRQLGDPQAAHKSLEEAYRLLLVVSPQNPNWRGQVSLLGSYASGVKIHASNDVDMLGRFFSVLNDTAAVLSQLGDLSRAMTKYYEALYIQQQLVRNHSNHARIVSFKHGLAAQWARMGNFQAGMGLTAKALACFQEAQGILSGLVKDYPRHENLAEFRRDQAANHEFIGDVLADTGDLKSAIGSYQKALPIRERLALESGAVTEYQVELARASSRFGILQAQAGQLDPAQQSLRQAIDRQRLLVDRLPQIKDLTRSLVRQLGQLGDVQRRAGQFAEASASIQQARELLEKLPPVGFDLYDLALLRAAASALVGQGKPELTAAEQEQRKREADLAMQSLGQVVANGFKDLDRLQKDHGLDPLRARPDFVALVADVQKKSKILTWTDDLEAAKALAVRQKKDLFLYFNGSDWADHPVVLKKTFLAREEFYDFAQKHFVMVELDSPRYKPKSKHAGTVNELMTRWQVRGFPTLVLADGYGRPYGRFEGINPDEGLKDYIKRLEALGRVRIRRDDLLAKAASSQGRDKARWLDAALNVVPQQYLAEHGDLIRAVRQLDADDQAGLRSKYLAQEAAVRRREAQALGRRGDWAGAVGLLTTALEELKPPGATAAGILVERGNSRAELGRFDKAADDYAWAIELAPQSSNVWYSYALARLAAGQEEEYRTACQSLLERIGPGDMNVVQAWCLAPHPGAAWAAMVQSAEGLRDQYSGNYFVLRQLGRACYRAGRFDAAVAPLERAVQVADEQNRDFVDSEMAFLAMAHHRLGHAAEAKRWLAKMAEAIAQRDTRRAKDKDAATGNDTWGNRAAEMVFRCEVEALLGAGPVELDDARRLAFARAYARLGQWDKALPGYDKLLEQRSDDAQLLLERGRAHERLGHKDKADADYTRAEKLLTKSVADLRAAAEKSPAEREALDAAYRQLARAQRQAGRPAQACATLFAAADLWPQEESRRFGIAGEAASLISLIGKDPSHPTAEEQAERTRVGDRVMALLREVVAAGYEHTNRLPRDKEWGPIRQRDDFRALQAEIDIRGKFPAPTEETLRLVGHAAGRAVMAVAVSPDGRRALSGGADGTVRLWDLVTGKELRRVEGINGTVYGVSFSPDGRRALIASEEPGVRLWDVETGKEIRRLVGHTGWVATARFLPDGRRALTGGSDALLRLWDTESGKEIRSFKGHEGSIRDLAVSPDGRCALSGGDDKAVHLWDLESGKELGTFKAHDATVWSVAFAPDGRRGLTGCGDGRVIVWDLEGGKELRRAPGEDKTVRDVAFSPDGRSVLIAGTQKLSLWDTETDRELYPSSQTVSHTRAAFLPGGKLAVTADADGFVRLWSLSEGADRLALYNRYSQFDKALAEYSRLISAQPADAMLRLARARLYGRKGQWEKASADLAEALRKHPGEADLWADLGRCLVMLGRWEQAAADYIKALELLPGDAAGTAQRKLLTAELAQWDGAFAKAAELRPDDAALWLAGGRAYAERGQKAKADVAYGRAGELLRGELNEFLQAGWWVVGKYPEDIRTPFPPETDPDPSRPAAALSGGAPLPWQHAPTTEYGLVNLRTVFNADHVTVYALTYVYSPDERKVTLRAGGDDLVRLWLNGQLVYELPGYKAWPFGLDRVSVTLRPGRNMILAKIVNFGGDHSLLLRIADGPLDRGLQAAELGLWAEGAAEFAKFMGRTKPVEDQDWTFWYYYTHYLVLSNQAEEARRLGARLLERHGRTTDTNLAWHLVRSLNYVPGAAADPTKLVTFAQMGMTAAPTEKWRRVELGLAHYRAGQFDQAVRQITESGEDQSSPRAWATLALAHHRLGHADEARKWLDRLDGWYAQETTTALALARFRLPWDWETWRDFLSLYREARALIRGPAAKDDPNAAILQARGRLQLLTDRGEYDAATALVKDLLARQGDQPLPMFVAATYYRSEAERLRKEAAGKPSPAADQADAQAQALYGKLLRLQPDDPLVVAEVAASLLAAHEAQAAKRADWKVLEPIDLKSAGGATLTRQADGSILAGGANPNQDTYTLTAKVRLKGITAFRLEALPDPSLPNQGPGRVGNFVLSEISVEAGGKVLPWAAAAATHSQDGWPITAAIDGSPTTGWAILPHVGQAHHAVFVLKTPLDAEQEVLLTVRLAFQASPTQHALGRFRLSLTTAPVTLRTVYLEGLATTAATGWTRVAAARALRGEWQPALAALQKAQAMPSGNTGQEWYLLALVHEQLGSSDQVIQELERAYAGLSNNSADEVPRQLIREALAAGLQRTPADPAALARRARLLLRFGQREAAAADFRKLAELEPKNTEWPLRLAQLRPEVHAFWNFDLGPEGWQAAGCQLIPADGFLKLESTSKDPHVVIAVKAPAGWKKVTLRTRFRGTLNAQLFWKTGTMTDFTEAASRRFVMQGGGDRWTETVVYFKADMSVTGLRFDPDNSPDVRMDIQSITLSDVQGKDDLAAALDVLTSEIVAQPRSADLRRQRGSLYARVGRPEEATTEFLQALDLLPDAKGTWYADRGGVDDELVKWDEVFARAVKERPKDTELWIARTRYFASKGQWRQAVEASARVLELNPSDPWNWFCDAPLRLKIGDLEGFRRDRDELIKRWGTTSEHQPSDFVAKTCMLLPPTASDLSVAVKLAEQTLTAPEKDEVYRWYLMDRFLVDYREGQYARAVERAKKVDPSATGTVVDATTFALLALVHHQLGQPTEARAALGKAQAMLEKGMPKPERDERLDGEWHNWLRCEVLLQEAEKLLNAPHRREAEAAVQAGRWAEALRHLDHLVQADPTFWPDRVLRDRCYAYLGQWAKWEKLAAEYGKQFDSKPPDDPNIWMEQAYVRLRRGDVAGYRRVCARMMEHFAADPTWQFITVWTCTLGPDALPDMAPLLRLAAPMAANNPKAPHFVHGLGAAYYRMGQHGPAVEHLHKALQADPGWGGHVLNWVTLALAYHRQGQTDEAIQWWEKTVAGLVQAMQGKPLESEGVPWTFRDWLIFKALLHEAQPLFAEKPYAGDPRLAGSRARFLALGGHWDKAVAGYDAAVQAHPADVRLFADRAAAHMQLKHWDRALADWLRAGELDPKNSWYVDQRARCHGHLGQWDKAAEDWTAYQKLVENPCWGLRERAICLDRLEQWDKALADHDEALRKAPENDRPWFRIGRGEHWAWHGRWKETAADFALALDRPSPDWGFWTWRDLALGFLLAGDAERFQKARGHVLASLDQPPADGWEATWRLWVLTAAPGAATRDNREQLLQLAGLADDYHRPRLTAAVQLRSGQAKEAAELFAKNPGGGHYLYLAALAEKQLGNHNRALKLVAEADAWMKELQAKMPDKAVPYAWWQEWAFFLALQREARAAVNGGRPAN